jgi:nicotinamidase-related amidase
MGRQKTYYPPEILNEEDDDGTMPGNVADLGEAVVGHKIVSASFETKLGRYNRNEGLVLTLDNGRRVILVGTDDCCAYTALEAFMLDPTLVDHIITGIGTTENYSRWHIYADFGDVMQLQVGWSCGNPFYYGYGFDITVEDI